MKNPIPLRPAPAANQAAAALYRAAFASFVSAARGLPVDDVCKAIYPPSAGALEIVTKADVAVATTTASGWASQLADSAVGGFLADLATASAAASIMGMSGPPLAMPAGGGDPITLKFPQRPAGPSARPWVAEGGAIPITSDTFSLVELVPGTIASIAVVSRELWRRSMAEAVFRSILRADAAISVDAAFFGDAAATAYSSAGLLYAATAVTTTGDLQGDLSALARSVGAFPGSGRVVFVTGPGRAAAIGLRNDIRATVLPSSAVAEDRIVAIDPAAIVYGFAGMPDFEVAEHATIHMSDTPLPIVDSGTADPVRSLFQTGSLAVRMTILLTFAARRAGAAAYVDGVYFD